MISESMVKIGENFKLPDYVDLSILDSLPIYIHRYGDKPPPVDHFNWISYRSKYGHMGQIDFARKCETFMPNAAEYLVNYLSKIIDITDISGSVSFIRTSGNVAAHIDEMRTTCINIGIRNTESAITRFYNTDGTLSDFTVAVGDVYLMDVSKRHSVITNSKSVRLLMSYNILCSFENILCRIQGK